MWGTTLERYGAYPSTARTAPARLSTVRSGTSLPEHGADGAGEAVDGTERYGAYPSTARTAPARLSTVRSTCSSVMTAAGAST